MTYYRINKRYNKNEDGKDVQEYYVMPYDLIGTIKRVGIWPVFLDFLKGRAFFSESIAERKKAHSIF